MFAILILSSHQGLGCLNDVFPSGFPTKILCAFLISPKHATWPTHLIPPDLTFPLPRLFQRFHPSPRPFVTFYDKSPPSEVVSPLALPQSWRTCVFFSVSIFSNLKCICSALNIIYHSSMQDRLHIIAELWAWMCRKQVW